MGHAIFQQRSGMLGVAVTAQCGVLTADQLIGLGVIANKLPVHGTKLTTRQTIIFLIEQGNLDAFRAEVERIGLQIGVFGNVVRNVKGCAGNDQLCQRSIGDAFGLGVKLQERFMNQEAPFDFKISTAGCPRGCTDPFCADFGAIAVGKDVFDIYIGGRGGTKMPRHGQLIANAVAGDKVADVLEFVLGQYREMGGPKERLCRTIDRCGIAAFTPPEELYTAGVETGNEFLAFIAGK